MVYRDIVYERFGLVVELDGRVGHELSRDRWADMGRDLDAVVSGLTTIRLGWRHAEDHPCRTARRLAVVLGRRGWAGAVHPCGAECEE